MKKITIITMLITAAVVVNAQEQVTVIPGQESQLVNELRANGGVVRPSILINTEVNPILKQQAKTEAKRVASATADKAGYANPRGTFFLGMDKKGEGKWMLSNGVIGAWSDTIDSWIWPNTTTGDYTKITYNNAMMEKYPSYTENALYGQDIKGNYLDSVTSVGGWTEYFVMGANGDDFGDRDQYCWKHGMPVQVVDRPDGSQEKFQLLQQGTLIKATNSGLVAGSLPSGHSVDGLWPLTQAEPIQLDGISMAYLDANQNYLFGSNMTKMVTVFDKPQAPLYVKDITLATTAKGYSKVSPKKFKFTSLHMEIQDMQGKVLASSDATSDNVTDINYSAHIGKLITFSINPKQSEYKEFLSEGILLSDSFQVVLTGFVPTDMYGLYAAKANTHASNTTQWNESAEAYNNNYEPYIQLNGIMPRWEYYADFVSAEKYGYKTGVRGDTIDINFVTAFSPYYKYIAHFAGEDYTDGSEFDIYSSFVPYDSITRMWKLDIDKPTYIKLSAGYDENVGTEEDPVTLWNYLRVFWMQIYADEMPVIGDHIQIGMLGKYTYFNIVSVDGVTAIQPISQTERAAGVQKVVDKRGVFRILRGNKMYNLQGLNLN